jgi:hypothetical protein
MDGELQPRVTMLRSTILLLLCAASLGNVIPASWVPKSVCTPPADNVELHEAVKDNQPPFHDGGTYLDDGGTYLDILSCFLQ